MNAKNRIYAMIAFMLVGSAAFYFFGFRLLIQNVETESNKYIELKKNSILLNEKSKALKTLEDAYTGIKDQFPRIDGTMLKPSQEDILGFLVSIEGLEQKTGVHVTTTIRDLVVDPRIKWSVFPLDVVVNGSYTSVYKFLTYFQSVPQSIYIEKIELTRGQSRQSVGADGTAVVNEGAVDMIIASKILSSVSAPTQK